MKKITTTLLLCMLTASPAMAQPERKPAKDAAMSHTDPSAPAPRWKAEIGGEEEHELRHSFVAPDGTTWLLTAARTAASPQGRFPEVRLIAVAATGDELARYPIAQSLPAKNVARFDGVAVRKDGSVAVFVTTDAGELLAVTFNARTGAPITQMRLGRTREDHLVTGIVAAEEGRLLLIGRLKDRAWMMKLDAELGIRWERTLEDEELTVLHDAAVGTNGSMAAIGSQSLEDGPRLWVGLITPEGHIAARKHLAGHQGRIARKGDTFAIVHDRAGMAGFDVIARGYSIALEETWSTTLAEAQEFPVAYEIAARPAGGWLVAGPKSDRLWLAELRDGGTIAWSYAVPAESAVFESVWQVGPPVLTGSDVILPFTLQTVDERKRLRREVRVTRLPLR